ncbi:MAG: hypothetical protein MI861_28720 [Pirellulales bacterium]|nr:hypothetical protein [Pirellulales bacterium]
MKPYRRPMMGMTLSPMKNLLISTAIVSLLMLPGCAWREGILGVDRCADIPAGAVPNPLGTAVCGWQTEQLATASIDRTVFYNADFVGSSEELSPAAVKRISELLQSNASANPVQWVVEPSGQSELDRQRTSSVASTLAELGWQGEYNVEVGYPPALGLRGGEAERVGRAAAMIGNQGGNATSAGFGAFGNSGQFGRGVSNIGGFF